MREEVARLIAGGDRLAPDEVWESLGDEDRRIAHNVLTALAREFIARYEATGENPFRCLPPSQDDKSAY